MKLRFSFPPLAVALALCGILHAQTPSSNQAPSAPAPAGGDASDQGGPFEAHIKELLRANQVAQALQEAQSETRSHPDDSVGWFALGEVDAVLKRFPDAIAAFRKSSSINPKMQPAVLEEGMSLAWNHQYDDAIEALSRAIDMAPDSMPAWSMLFQCYRAKDDLVGAEQKFRESVDANPKSYIAWYMLGLTQTSEHLTDSATRSLEKAVELKPDFVDALKLLGLAYADSHQPDKAADCLARAAAIHPDAETLNNLGYTYLTLGQTDKAIETLNKALAADPRYEKSLINLANAYTKEQRWTEVKDICLQLAAIDPKAAADLSKTFPADATAAGAPSTNAVAPITPTTAPTQLSAANEPAPPAAPSPATAQSLPPSSPSTNSPATATAPEPVPVVAPATAPAQGLTQKPPQSATPPAPLQPPAASPAATPAPGTYTTGPPPAWVKPLDPDAVTVPATAGVDGGIDYLLIDNQQSIVPAASFQHYTVRLVNEEGLQVGADLRAVFDPSYQTLTLNWLRVKRDGVWQDRLATEEFQVLHREENLDSQMLDGRYSVVCHLQDARVGDLIDFAYTIAGANPVFGGKYVDSFLTSFTRQVHRFSTQLIVPPGRPLHVKAFGSTIAPTQTMRPDQSELVAWQADEVPATTLEPRTSGWYDALGWVQVSEFDSWKSVSDWGLATFSLDEAPSGDLADKITEIRLAHNSPEMRARDVIRFVQNDIRYLGIEMGPNSYRPTPATQVIEHRFGDCKDKTQLCVVMLRALGISACPALVNAERRGQTAQMLPSPLAFDHVIVEMVIDGEHYWVDVTRTGQCGRLREYYVDDFQAALPLDSGTTGLVPMTTSRGSLPQISVEETYSVPSATGPSGLAVHTIFKGRSAETMRTIFDASSHDELQKYYLNYYSKIYTQIKVQKPLSFLDFPDDNRFETWQEYSIGNLWTRDNPDAPYVATFTPRAIADAVGSTIPSPRTTPYELDHPTDISEDMRIEMFHKWNVDTTPTDIETPHFIFTEEPSLDGNVVDFEYHFATTARDVLPADVSAYNDQVTRIRNHVECRLTYRPGFDALSSGAGADPAAAFHPNWQGAVIAGLVFLIAAGGAIGVLFIRPEGGYRDIPHGDEMYEGVGGWLIPNCIGIVLGILAHARTLWFDLSIILDQAKWNVLTQPGTPRYDPYWAPALLTETAGSMVLFVMLILAGVLMMLKRFTLPAVMIAVLIGNLIYTIADHMLATQVVSLARTETGTAGMAIFRVVLASAIWIPYFLVSKRVKATFRF